MQSLLGGILGRGVSAEDRARREMAEKERELKHRAYRAELVANRAQRKMTEIQGRMVQLAQILSRPTTPLGEKQQLRCRIGELIQDLRSEQCTVQAHQQQKARIRSAKMSVQKQQNQYLFHKDMCDMLRIRDARQAELFAAEVEEVTNEYARVEDTMKHTDDRITEQMELVTDMQGGAVSQGDIDLITAQLMQDTGLTSILPADELRAIESVGVGKPVPIVAASTQVTPAQQQQPQTSAPKRALTGFEDIEACLEELNRLETKK